jgi:microcystin-dependent protein
MSEPFLGEIRMWACAFAPKNWAYCNGGTMSIAQNEALYACLGTNFGGDGRTNFMLPDMRGRVPVCQSQNYVMGVDFGYENVTLNLNQLAAHTHEFTAVNDDGASGSPVKSYTFAKSNSTTGNTPYGQAASLQSLNPATIGATGGGQSHTNVQPSTVVNFCISLSGLFPSRN